MDRAKDKGIVKEKRLKRKKEASRIP